MTSFAKAVKHRFFGLGVVARYGTFWPNEVLLPGSDRAVALDPRDQRAWRKLVLESVRGRVSTPMMFWRDHVDHHPGGLYLDVGANYGECMAYGSYPTGRCIAVEANSTLVRFLEQTRVMHPDAARISIANVLVDRQAAASASLWFSPHWTGGGSATASGVGLKEVVVPAQTLEQLSDSSGLSSDVPLVLKMDVEGHEGRALAGFPSLFERPRALGILEFDTGMLASAGTDPKEFFESLLLRFHVFMTFKRQRVLRTLRSWEELSSFGSDGHIHRDLVFASSSRMICPAWSQ